MNVWPSVTDTIWQIGFSAAIVRLAGSKDHLPKNIVCVCLASYIAIRWNLRRIVTSGIIRASRSDWWTTEHCAGKAIELI
jgi:hypothetical protein